MSAVTEEHRAMLVDSVRDYLAGEGLGPGTVKSVLSVERLRTVWRGCAEMGWLQSCVPEARGGLGLGLSDAAAMLEEVGRALMPLPVADAIAVAAWLPAEATSDHEKVAAWLQGQECLALVHHGKSADALVGATGEDKEAWVEYVQADVAALRASWANGRVELSLLRVQSEGFGLDPLVKTGRLVAEEHALCHWHAPLHQSEWLRFCRARRLLRLSELLGVGDQALDIAVRHAREREQFGRPIGANQAIKHRLADCWMALDNSRLVLRDACVLLERDDPGAEAAMLAAWILVCEASIAATGRAIQTLGALGISWECPAHFYLKRARHIIALLGRDGSPEDMLDRLWALG